MAKLLLLTVALSVCALPASAGESQKRTGPSANPAPSCTDLSGEPVPCPERHNQVVVPSANKGSAGVNHCVDLLGNDVPCPGEKSTPSVTAERPGTSDADAGGSAVSAVTPNRGGASSGSKKAGSVLPASSTSTSVVPAESASDSPCHDLLGEPVSCPVDVPMEATTAGTAASSNSAIRSAKAPSEAATASSSAIYVEPSLKAPTSLERSLPRNI